MPTATRSPSARPWSSTRPRSRCRTRTATPSSCSVQLPDAAGETFAFPIVQTCTEGETSWTEVAEEGQDAEELEHPAPLVTVTEAQGSDEAPAASTDDEADEDGNGLALVGLGTGVAGIVIGGIALARSRKA